MITYTVYYKRTNSLFWKKLKKVKGDSFIEGGSISLGPHNENVPPPSKNIRYFILEDETRIEIDMHCMVIKFSKDRNTSIMERIAENSGQEVKPRPR